MKRFLYDIRAFIFRCKGLELKRFIYQLCTMNDLLSPGRGSDSGRTRIGEQSFFRGHGFINLNDKMLTRVVSKTLKSLGCATAAAAIVVKLWFLERCTKEQCNIWT